MRFFLLALKLLSASLLGLTYSPIIQTEDMLKDYVTKIQDLETELHRYRSFQTKSSLSPAIASLGNNCSVAGFAADILPSSKNSTIFKQLSWNECRSVLKNLNLVRLRHQTNVENITFCRWCSWSSRSRGTGKGMGAHHAPRKSWQRAEGTWQKAWTERGTCYKTCRLTNFC